MEKLIKPSEYAKEIGISRQAVYAKIKRGILKSKNVEGKLYIVMDSTVTSDTTQKPKTSKSTAKPTTSNQTANYQELLKAKDETISVLKDTIQDLKESNKEISTTLRGEIDLLKEAFYEMRNLYTNQIERHTQSIEAIEVVEQEEMIPEENVLEKWVSIKKFIKAYNLKDKKIDKYKKIFKKLYKQDDNRVKIDNDKYKVNILEDFSDILE